MGRNAAGESFLRGYFRHASARQWWAFLTRQADAAAFSAGLQAEGRDGAAVQCVSHENLTDLAKPGLLFYPGPNLGELAWKRALANDAAWSLCGVTHTICSHGAMDPIVELLTTPVQPWDALICTSTAGHRAVMAMLEAQAEFLRRRLGTTKVVLPQLPVIPLGVHVDDFGFSDEQRASARAAISADIKTHVVLFTGRLSFHAKAHPLPMYQALEVVAARLPAGERLLLVEFGQHPNVFIRDAFDEAAQSVCPHVARVHLDGSQPGNRALAWASADVFCSLSDNLQETFGLTPLEAMAAGLPVVVSDWDGYKDTVRHEVDGFRVRTLMPAPGLGSDLSARHALGLDTYDRYIGQAASLVAVDARETAEALWRLISNPALRRTMGAAGRRRALETFDWAVVIPQYERLWEELRAIRVASATTPAARSAPTGWPARRDPFTTFQGYASDTLGPNTVLSLSGMGLSSAVAAAQAYRAFKSLSFAGRVHPNDAEVAHVLGLLSQGDRSAQALVADLPKERQLHVMRTLGWLAKVGILAWHRQDTAA